MFEVPSDLQLVFDTVARHLLKQNKKSLGDNGYCVYRSPEGLKCAAGCLIPDDKYEAEMEEIRWDGLIRKYSIIGLNSEQLVCSLQEIHDQIRVEDWKQSLEIISYQYGLNDSVLNETQLNPE